MTLSDDFIEDVITPESETTNPSETMNVTRAFYGLEAKTVEQEDYITEDSTGSDE